MTNPPTRRAEIVSFDSEPLILVNSHDEAVGEMLKADCHQRGGRLHRAFSLFIFNSSNELLVHQRADSKPLWGGFWTNSCCSHPRVGESIEEAIARRSEEELGFTTNMRFVYKFEYTALQGHRHGTRALLCVCRSVRRRTTHQLGRNQRLPLVERR